MASLRSASSLTTPSSTTRPALTSVSMRVELRPEVPMSSVRSLVARTKSPVSLLAGVNQCEVTERTPLWRRAMRMAWERIFSGASPTRKTWP